MSNGYPDPDYAMALLLEEQNDGAPEEIGPATAVPPKRGGSPTTGDPGSVPAWGPQFVPFVAERFKAVEIFLAKLLDDYTPREIEGWRVIASGQSDSGQDVLTIPVMTAQPMQKYVLHRMYVHAEGYTFASSYTNAAGHVQIQVDGASWDGVSLVSGSGQLPIVFTQGRLAGLEVQDGETLSVVVTKPPASTRIEVRCSGVLSSLKSTLG